MIRFNIPKYLKAFFLSSWAKGFMEVNLIATGQILTTPHLTSSQDFSLYINLLFFLEGRGDQSCILQEYPEHPAFDRLKL